MSIDMSADTSTHDSVHIYWALSADLAQYLLRPLISDTRFVEQAGGSKVAERDATKDSNGADPLGPESVQRCVSTCVQTCVYRQVYRHVYRHVQKRVYGYVYRFEPTCIADVGETHVQTRPQTSDWWLWRISATCLNTNVKKQVYTHV